MNTPLSDEMMALLNYANETTEGADSNLGDAVKTLCDGYGKGGGDLPTFYDWLMPAENRNDGAYIDTGIAVPQDADTLVTIVYMFDNQGRNSLKIFGTTRSTGNASEGCLTTYTATSTSFSHKSGGYLSNLNGSMLPHVQVVSYKIGSADTPAVSVDGVSGYKPFGGTDTAGQGNFCIFGAYVSAWGRMGTGQSKCYGMQIFIGGDLVFNGRPAQDASGAGMYDLVSGTMLYNASANGTFQVGND